MTTDLVPVSDLERMALAFAKSNMFGAKTPDQVLALLLLAQAEGQHPAIAMRDFDVINGRPAKKAEAMLRSFLAAGGKVEWHRIDDEMADATFSHPQGGSARISWDIPRAKKAGLAGRDMYTKFARQMLRSRVVSEGCRTVYPAATSGMYEPGEAAQIPERDMGPAEVVQEAKPETLQVQATALVTPKKLMSDCGSLAALEAVWKALPKETQLELVQHKDNCKLRIIEADHVAAQ